jgi:hypothetical protein
VLDVVDIYMIQESGFGVFVDVEFSDELVEDFNLGGGRGRLRGAIGFCCD